MKIIKIPLNAGGLSKRSGIEKGPDAVEKHLKDFHTNESGLAPLFEITELTIDNSNLDEAHQAIYNEADKLGANPQFAMLVGGDHSMTYPAFKAFAKNNPGAGLIVLDAHPDCQENHMPPTHEDYLRVLIDEGILNPQRIALIGVRNMSKDEKKYLEEKKIKNYSMREISFEGLQEVTDSVMSVAREWSRVYLSIDIDVLDTAFAPGTGYPEPGGLTTRELIYFVQRLKLIRNIAIADITEVNPDLDVNEMTAKAAAKVIFELN